jgi:hypothetical protein
MIYFFIALFRHLDCLYIYTHTHKHTHINAPLCTYFSSCSDSLAQYMCLHTDAAYGKDMPSVHRCHRKYFLPEIFAYVTWNIYYFPKFCTTYIPHNVYRFTVHGKRQGYGLLNTNRKGWYNKCYDATLCTITLEAKIPQDKIMPVHTAPNFLTSTLDAGERWASSPGPFTLGEATGNHWRGDWVGPGTGLDPVEMKKSLASVGSRTPDIQSLARRYTDLAIPAPYIFNSRAELW